MTETTSQSADETRAVIIVGSGPAGYTAAVYAARANLAPLVFEGWLTAGGALMNTTEVENFPGFRDGIQGPALMDEMRAQAERFGAEIIWNARVQEINGADRLESLTLEDTVTGETSNLPATGLFIAIGHDPRSELLTGQVDLDDDGYVLVQHPSTHTNLDGVFACGDLVDHHYRQAVTAAGTGCAAALDAERYLAELAHVADPSEAQARADAELVSETVQTAGA